MRLRTAVQVTTLLLYQAICARAGWDYVPVAYPSEDDLYFDRIVPLTLNISSGDLEKKNVATGVFISSDRILTSYNPFRSFIRDRNILKHLIASALIGRERLESEEWIYDQYRTKLACGRPVQFLPDELIEHDLWHGADKKNCPLHDLIVFRVYGDHRVSHFKLGQLTAKDFPPGNHTDIFTNIFLTELATSDDHLDASFKYCELNNVDQLQVVQYEPEDDAVVDCDMWLPRKWGRFICILNKKHRGTLTSGAMLVSNNKLFGVGSFLFSRGDKSILVFTDVRPYRDLILKTCTYEDSKEKRPKYFPLPLSW